MKSILLPFQGRMPDVPQSIAAKHGQPNRIHEYCGGLHASGTSESHISYIAVYLNDLLRLDELT